jgi:hypothetical protein
MQRMGHCLQTPQPAAMQAQKDGGLSDNITMALRYACNT